MNKKQETKSDAGIQASNDSCGGGCINVIFCIIAVVIAHFTCPDRDDHVKEWVSASTEQSDAITGAFVGVMADEMLQYKSYYVFSYGEISVLGVTRKSYGWFGFVWIS